MSWELRRRVGWRESVVYPVIEKSTQRRCGDFLLLHQQQPSTHTSLRLTSARIRDNTHINSNASMTSSPSVHAQAAQSTSSPAFSAGNTGTPAAAGVHVAGVGTSHAAPSPASALLASLTSNPAFQAMTPGASSPSALLAGRQQNLPSPSSVQYPGTPGAQHALLAQALRQQQAETGRQHQGGSVAGSGVTHAVAGTTSADAPNEARRLLRALLDEQGQGRLSLARIANEVNMLVQDMCVLPTISTSSSLKLDAIRLI